jgi:hypothetical protein
MIGDFKMFEKWFLTRLFTKLETCESFRLRAFYSFKDRMKLLYLWLEDRFFTSDDPVAKNLVKIKRKYKFDCSILDILGSTGDSNPGIWSAISKYGANDLTTATLTVHKKDMNWSVLARLRVFSAAELKTFTAQIPWNIALETQPNLSADIISKAINKKIGKAYKICIEKLKNNDKMDQDIKAKFFRMLEFHKRLEDL